MSEFDLSTRCPRLARAHRERRRELEAMRRFGTSLPSLALSLAAMERAGLRAGQAMRAFAESYAKASKVER